MPEHLTWPVSDLVVAEVDPVFTEADYISLQTMDDITELH